MNKAEQFQAGLMVSQMRTLKQSMEDFNTLYAEASQTALPIDKEAIFVAIRLRISQIDDATKTLIGIKKYINKENLSYIQEISTKLSHFAYQVLLESDVQDLYFSDVGKLPVGQCEQYLDELKFFHIQSTFSQ
ncbi:hypothetical protein SS50377_26954 [Spironucleus salmonicida]|uniref:Uncharacterized protein n=1 Tax=Spironucleus salmonicida TaxID=348837 RepID=V6LSA8_9EUKA|nr:hypothetical protein SS50377_26954 [Spironucleus salmonicida]|eukprot:EST47465.1 Hypothetical protein SS50377_12450 [Spironucleus salmonicida]